MDNLEKYIRENRDQFDDKFPDPALWDHIASRLPQNRTDSRRIVMWKAVSIAAVALVLILSGVIAGIFMGQNRVQDNPEYVEFMQAQQYYNVVYNKKKSELSRYAYDPEVDRDLNEMDKMYNDLSREYLNTDEPDKTELINAMIQVYKKRISLLERVLNRIEQNETQSIQEDEKVKI